jgi:hypothetical protein
MRVAIIGTAPASVNLAPYSDKSWDIWACSPGNRAALPRVTVWFEMHGLRAMMAPENRAISEPYFAWLKEQSEKDTFQVVMQELNEYVPKAIPFPRDEMLYLFGHNWFSSSIAWMLALAIARGAEEIGLWGVDMAAEQEHYTSQRAGCTRFMEIAEERGIKVSVPPESCLAEAPPLYGYSEASAFGRRLDAVMALAVTQRAQLAATVDNARLQTAFFDGAMEQLRYIQRTWLDGSEVALELGPLKDAAKIYADKLMTGETLNGRMPAAAKPETKATLIEPSVAEPQAPALSPEMIPSGAKPNGSGHYVER